MRMRSIYLFLLVLSLSALCPAQLTSKPMSITWKRGSDIPLPRGGYFAAWVKDRLWLAGGSYWKDGVKLWTNEASLYEPKTGKWTVAEPLPKAFGYGVTAKVGKSVYLFCGADGDGKPNRDIYRLSDGKWSRIGESPFESVYPAYSVVGSKVYIFGGSTSATDVTKASADTWIFDTRTKKWEQAPTFPGPPRQIFSAASLGTTVYIFGGLTQESGQAFHNLSDAYKFDTVANKWQSIKKMPIAMRAFWAVADKASIYLIGGYAESGLNTVYRYSTDTDQYEMVSTLPQPLMDTKFIYHDGVFYGASGEDKLASRFSGIVIGKIDRGR